MTVNSTLSQNWVGCTVRTPKAQAARTLHPGRVHAVRWASYRGLLPVMSQAVSQRPLAVSHPPCCDTKLYHHIEAHAALVACRVARATLRVVALLRHIVGRWASYRSPCRLLCRDTRPPSCQDTNNCTATHPSGQAPRTRCCSPHVQVGRVVAPCWPFRSPAACPQHAPTRSYRALARAQP